MAPSSGHGVGETTADTQGTRSSSFGKFWASVDEQSEEETEEEVQITSPSDVFIADAARNGFQAEDLIQAEHEIVAAEKDCYASPSSAAFRCPKTRKIVNATANDRSLKQHGKPWKGSLPKPRISLPKTLGDAVIKNPYTRRHGGHLIPRLFKMALPSTIHSLKEDQKSLYETEDWPPLLKLSALEKQATLAPESSPEVQYSKIEMPNYSAGRMLIVNGNKKAWFQPSKAISAAAVQNGGCECGIHVKKLIPLQLRTDVVVDKHQRPLRSLLRPLVIPPLPRSSQS
jgi:hypothetical protein